MSYLSRRDLTQVTWTSAVHVKFFQNIFKPRFDQKPVKSGISRSGRVRSLPGVKKLLRKILGLPLNSIGKARALEIARAECVRHGWEWREPTFVKEKVKQIIVVTDMRMLGGNVRVEMDAFSGDVIYAGRMPG